MHLLITRPLRQAKITAEKLKAQGHTCQIEPLLEIEHLTTSLPAPKPNGKFKAIILTSKNSLKTLDNQWPKNNRDTIPVLTVGHTTQTAAQNIGFLNSQSNQGSALDMVNVIPNWMQENNIPANAPLLYPCAKNSAHDLPLLLEQQKIQCTPWIVYQTNAAESFTPQTANALTNTSIDGVVLYSARTTMAFCKLWESLPIDTPRPQIFALSSGICDKLPKKHGFSCIYPQKPTEMALFEIIAEFQQNR